MPSRKAAPSKPPTRFWCYYCDSRHDDEQQLIAHQRAKHFLCKFCDPKSASRNCLSLGGLLSHVKRTHGAELASVPGSISGRTDTDVIVLGMKGNIPQSALDRFEEIFADEMLNTRFVADPDLIDDPDLINEPEPPAAAVAATNPLLQVIMSSLPGSKGASKIMQTMQASSGGPGGKTMLQNIQSLGAARRTYDPDTEGLLDRWVQAKRAKDTFVADSIRLELRKRDVDPDVARPADREDLARAEESGARPPINMSLAKNLKSVGISPSLALIGQRFGAQIAEHQRQEQEHTTSLMTRPQAVAPKPEAPPVLAFDPSMLANLMKQASKEKVSDAETEKRALKEYEENAKREAEARQEEELKQKMVDRTKVKFAFLQKDAPEPLPDAKPIIKVDKKSVENTLGVFAEAARAAAAAEAAMKLAPPRIYMKAASASASRTKLLTMEQLSLLKHARDVGVNTEDLGRAIDAANPQEAITQLALDLESKESWMTVTFKPGRLGINADWYSGKVKKVYEKAAGGLFGVKEGMVFITIDGGKFSKAILKEKIAGSFPFKVVFATTPGLDRDKRKPLRDNQALNRSRGPRPARPAPEAQVMNEGEFTDEEVVNEDVERSRSPMPQRASRRTNVELQSAPERRTRENRQRAPIVPQREDEDEVRGRAVRSHRRGADTAEAHGEAEEELRGRGVRGRRGAEIAEGYGEADEELRGRGVRGRRGAETGEVYPEAEEELRGRGVRGRRGAELAEEYDQPGEEIQRRGVRGRRGADVEEDYWEQEEDMRGRGQRGRRGQGAEVADDYGSRRRRGERRGYEMEDVEVAETDGHAGAQADEGYAERRERRGRGEGMHAELAEGHENRRARGEGRRRRSSQQEYYEEEEACEEDGYGGARQEPARERRVDPADIMPRQERRVKPRREHHARDEEQEEDVFDPEEIVFL